MCCVGDVEETGKRGNCQRDKESGSEGGKNRKSSIISVGGCIAGKCDVSRCGWENGEWQKRKGDISVHTF